MANNVELRKAKFSSRIFAFGADLICMVVVGLLLVVAAQFIVSNSPDYHQLTSRMDQIEIDSHLYARKDGESLIVTKAMEPEKETEEAYKTVAEIFDKRLKEFYSDPKFFDQTDPDSGMHLYDLQRIPEGQTYTDLFVRDEHGDIVPSQTAKWVDLYKFYAERINHDGVAYIMANNEYMDASRTITLVFVFIELLIPIVLSILVFEFAIPVFDRHGKRTLGKRIFKLGIVDSRGLSPKLGRFVCRFLLFFFAEVLLSVVGLLIPIVLSFSMVTFGKAGQSFHDYVTGTYVVDVSQDIICKDEEEYYKKQNLGEKFSPLSKDLELK